MAMDAGLDIIVFLPTQDVFGQLLTAVNAETAIKATLESCPKQGNVLIADAVGIHLADESSKVQVLPFWSHKLDNSAPPAWQLQLLTCARASTAEWLLCLTAGETLLSADVAALLPRNAAIDGVTSHRQWRAGDDIYQIPNAQPVLLHRERFIAKTVHCGAYHLTASPAALVEIDLSTHDATYIDAAIAHAARQYVDYQVMDNGPQALHALQQQTRSRWTWLWQAGMIRWSLLFEPAARRALINSLWTRRYLQQRLDAYR